MPAIDPKKLQKRVLSALILAPVVLGCIYLGGWAFTGLIILCAGLAFYEWADLARKTRTPFLFMLIGTFYIAASFYCCYLIRETYGAFPAIAFFTMVVASDSGGYFFGKLIGGPKMSGQISPNKTWAGYAGALLAPALISVSGAFSHGGSIVFFLLIGTMIGIACQTGDLLVSWFKRHARVKDAGGIIPGHGGLLDRVDSLMLSAPVFLASLKLFSYG